MLKKCCIIINNFYCYKKILSNNQPATLYKPIIKYIYKKNSKNIIKLGIKNDNTEKICRAEKP